jgi:hypothetical protein
MLLDDPRATAWSSPGNNALNPGTTGKLVDVTAGGALFLLSGSTARTRGHVAHDESGVTQMNQNSVALDGG